MITHSCTSFKRGYIIKHLNAVQQHSHYAKCSCIAIEEKGHFNLVLFSETTFFAKSTKAASKYKEQIFRYIAKHSEKQ